LSTIGKKIVLIAAACLFLLAAAVIFYRFDPGETALFPKCFFLSATGYECPGCGSQRAVHDLLHLRIRSAFRHNAFMLLALPYIFLGIYLEYLGGKRRFPRIARTLYGATAAIVVLVVIVAFWILRNIL
jgi:hypothetical protein